MFQFFNSIGAFIETIVNFVISLISSVMQLILMIGKTGSFLFAIIPNLPPFTIAMVTMIVVTAILLQLLNKGS